MGNFRFNLNASVTIEASGESGFVIGRAEYINSGNSYLVRYKTNEGSAAEAWWSEDALR